MGRARLAQAQPCEETTGRGFEILWHRVTAPMAVRVAAQQTSSAQPGTASSAVLFECLHGIGRATRLKAAGAAKPSLEKQPVKLDEADEATLWQRPSSSPHGAWGFQVVQPARLSKLSSSRRAASASATERAETNSVVAKPARNRTNHMPPAKFSAWRTNEARICRLSRVRVTARRACRLGTTQPTQSPAKVLSTDGCSCRAGVVDKSSSVPLFFRASAGKGPPLTWWSAK